MLLDCQTWIYEAWAPNYCFSPCDFCFPLTVMLPHFIRMPWIFCTVLESQLSVFWQNCIWLIENCYLTFNSVKLSKVKSLIQFTSNIKFTAKLGLGLLSLSPVFLATQYYMFCCFVWLHETNYGANNFNETSYLYTYP